MDLLDDDELLNLRGRAQRTDPLAVTQEERARHAAMPDANDALRAWAQAPAQEQAQASPHGTTCHLCERPARYQCKKCQGTACAGDYWVMFGLCRGCASEDRVKRFHAERRPEADNWLEGA